MKDTLDDLSARARRERLDEGDRARLDAMLRGSFEGRLLHEAGASFDREDCVRAGDDAVAQRIAERVLTRVDRGAPRRRRKAWPLVAIAACFVTAAATATVGHYRRASVVHRVESLEPGHPAGGASNTSATGLRPPAAPVIEVTALVTEVTVPEPERAVPTGASPAAAPAAVAQAPAFAPSSAASAAALFAAAGRARREGNLDEALRLYGSLQRRYPSTAESFAADIALGMLWMSRGSDVESLEHFRRYLQHSPRGDLVPEALWGEAEGLRKLGRADEAQKSLRSLLARFPDSPYADAARARLEAAKSTR